MSDYQHLSKLVYLVRNKVEAKDSCSRPYVGLEHMGANWSGLLGVADSSEPISENFSFEPGDILLGKLRPNLRKCEQVNFPGKCSTDILVLRANSSMDARFCAHVLRSEAVAQRSVSVSEGTRMPRASWRNIGQMQIFCPNLHEQRSIAEVFDAVSSDIAASEKLLGKLGQLRLGQVSAQLEILHSAETISSFVVDGPRNGIYKHQSSYGETGTPILRIDSFGGGIIFDLDGLRRVKVHRSEVECYSLRDGDIVINRVNSIDHIGKSALVRGLRENTIFESNVMRLRFDGNLLDPTYASLALSGDRCIRHFQSQAKSAISQASINKRDVLSCPVPVPSLEEQRRIVSIVEAHDERIAAERARLEKLRKLKAGLMDDLLTGRVRVEQLKDLPV